MPNKETLPTNTIEAIKSSIVRSDTLLDNGVPITLDETTVKSTNCYAYSMGIMYNFLTKTRGFYSPGFTERDNYKKEDPPEVLLSKIQRDLKNLGINYREIPVIADANLKDNEYLVKIYMADPNEKIPNGDFHFVRQDKESGMWFHKMGWERQPDIIHSDPGYEDENDSAPGTEPGYFISRYNDGFSYTYYPIGYLAIEEH